MAMETAGVGALSLAFLLFTTIAAAAAAPPYTPTDYILLDCGPSSNTTSAQDGRHWQADVLSDYLPSNAEQISQLAMASQQSPFVTQVPYMTARIFRSEFTYSFSKLSTGSKLLRLYFYPSVYNDTINTNSSFFSVIANNKYTLLSNFSAFLNSPSMLVKEYIIHIDDDNQQLNLTFLPSQNTPGSSSYAFVNGIEIVSVPDNLYIGERSVPIVTHAQAPSYDIHNSTALETVYRLNVGGNTVPATADTDMFRTWSQDDGFIFSSARGWTSSGGNVTVEYSSSVPAYTAPEVVYTTARLMLGQDNISLNYNMTWLFPVDPGFHYLLRLHFCEFSEIIKEKSDLVFSIFINNQTAELEADVIRWAGRRYVPVIREYVVFVEDDLDGRKTKQDLWLAMHPYDDGVRRGGYLNAFLNGLELFRLSLSNGTLAAPNPPPIISTTTKPPGQPTSPDKKNSKQWLLILAIAGGAAFVVVASSLVGFLIFRRQRRVKDHSATTSDNKSSWTPLSNKSRSSTKTNNSSHGSSLPANLCRSFSLEEILDTTGNFDEKFVIGVGGFGHVYKGYIDNGVTEVAIKRLNSSSNQGQHEFFTEIEMLSRLRHRHLVSLIGYCNENGEMILVYDYMSRGTLRDHLYKTKNPHLSWKKRLEICIGAAKGLHYLHTSAKQTIIHRDVKSTNILLDEKWAAKVSDFGISKMGPIDGVQTHVSTMVKGSLGYMDPLYYKSQQLTEKSDVYSFGVVLLEVLCARPAIVQNVPKEQVNLGGWVRVCHKRGTLDQIIDSKVKAEMAAESLNKYVEIALRCLKDKGVERPTMNDVVWSLEFALELQEDAEKRMSSMANEDESEGNTSGLLFLPGGAAPAAAAASWAGDDDDMFSTSEEAASSSSYSKSKSSSDFTVGSDGFKSQTVFTEIMNPSAR